MVSIAMTPGQFAAKKQQLEQEHQISLQGDSGTQIEDGYTILYGYDGTTLDVTVVNAPRFVPKSFAESRIKGWLEQ